MLGIRFSRRFEEEGSFETFVWRRRVRSREYVSFSPSCLRLAVVILLRSSFFAATGCVLQRRPIVGILASFFAAPTNQSVFHEREEALRVLVGFSW